MNYSKISMVAALALGAVPAFADDKDPSETDNVWFGALSEVTEYAPYAEPEGDISEVPLGYTAFGDRENLFERARESGRIRNRVTPSLKASIKDKDNRGQTRAWRQRGHVSLGSDLHVREPEIVYLGVEFETIDKSGYHDSYHDDDFCHVSLLDGDRILAEDSYKGGVAKLSYLGEMDAGVHHLTADIDCDARGRYRDLHRVRSIQLSGIYGETEATIRQSGLVNAGSQGSAHPDDPNADKPAEGVIWSVFGDGDVKDSEPEKGNVSRVFGLTRSFGQSLDFTDEMHSRKLAAKIPFRPREAGDYAFRIVTKSNICRNGYRYKDGDQPFENIDFGKCENNEVLHPAVSLTTGGRGVIMDGTYYTERGSLDRYGVIEVTDKDVESGLVLQFSARSKVELKRKDYGLVRGLGDLYRRESGNRKSEIGHSPTKEDLGIVTAQVFIKGPNDIYYRPLNKADTTR